MATADDPKRKNQFGDAAAASADALVQQIPTAGSQAGPVVGESASGSELGRNVTNLVNALPAAAGAARLVGGAGAMGAGAIGRLATGSNAARAVAPYVPPAIGLAGLGSAAAPAQQPVAQTPQQPASAVTSPSVPAPSSIATPPQAAPPQSQPNASAPAGLGIAGIQKTVGADGRVLYSDGNASSDASLLARGPISAQNMQAADNLAAASEAGTAGRLRTQQFNGEVAQAQAVNARPFASSGGSRGIRRAAGIGAGEQASIAAFNQARGTDRFSRTLGVEQQRLGADALRTAGAQRVAEGRLSLDAATAGLDARGRNQLLAAQDALTKATTPEARATAEDSLRALQGRYERPTQNRFTVVPGGTDELGNRQASTVLNNQTGEFVSPGQQKLPAGMTRQVGTAGGKPVYVDASGKRFVGN